MDPPEAPPLTPGDNTVAGSDIAHLLCLTGGGPEEATLRLRAPPLSTPQPWEFRCGPPGVGAFQSLGQ